MLKTFSLCVVALLFISFNSEGQTGNKEEPAGATGPKGAVSVGGLAKDYVPNKDAVEAKNQGNAALDKGDYEEALKLYNKSIVLDSRYPNPVVNRGGIFLRQKKYPEAIADFTKAIELDPKLALGYCLRGKVNSRLEKYAEAIADFTKAIELDPKDADAYNGRGYRYSDLKKYPEAIADHTKAIELDPKYAGAYHGRGNAYYDLKKYPEAIADYTKAIELDPKYADAFNNRGLTYSDLKKHSEAIADYTKAIELDPKYVYSYYNRGNAYSDLKKYAEALVDYTKAIELDPKHVSAYNGRARMYLSQQKYAEALVDLNKAIELDPKNVSAHTNREIAFKSLQAFSKPDLTPDPKVDEQLFMIRQLEHLYSQWPRDFGDPKNVAKDLARVRHQLVRGEEYAKEKTMDKRLIDMYEESIKLADNYSDFLKNINLIDGDFYDKKISEDQINLIGKTAEGLGAMVAVGFEPISASAILVEKLIRSEIESDSRNKKHEREKAFEIQKETNKYLNARSKTFGKIEIQADVLAEKLKLEPLEVGFDQENNDDEKVYKAWKEQDVDFLYQRIENLKKIRHRDPFVYFESGLILDQTANIYKSKNTLDSDSLCEYALKLAVDDYIRAVQLVPKGKQHNSIRANFIKSAAASASNLLYHSKKKDELSIWLANRALEIQPLDPDAKVRFIKAFALARNGRHDESLKIFEDCKNIIGDNYGVYYDWACLLSLAGKYDESFEKLKIAWDKGFRNIRWLKMDYDLSALRDKKNLEIKSLIAISLNYEIDYGFVWNNIGYTNNSEFDLVNFASRNIWIDKNGKEYIEVYFAKKVPVGKTTWFKGVFDGASPKQNKDFQWSVVCDENSRVKPIGGLDCKGSYKGYATLGKIDKSSIETTEAIKLEVFSDENGAIRVLVNGSTIIKDSLIRDCFVKQSGETVSGVVFFSNKLAYGWYQLPKDKDGEFTRAFWVEKE